MKVLLTLEKRKAESAGVESLLFSSNTSLSYQSGQYLRWRIDHPTPDNRGVTRYFTLSSAPSENFLMLTTRFSPQGSSFKNALHNLEIGSTVEANGPFGDFTYCDFQQKTVWIAGGIGITPFRSILTELDAKNIDAPITLLYSNKTPDIPFKTELDSLQTKRQNLKIIYTVTKPDSNWHGETSRIGEEFIKKFTPDYKDSLFYISGPKPIVEITTNLLIKLGVSRNMIKEDFFPGYLA